MCNRPGELNATQVKVDVCQLTQQLLRREAILFWVLHLCEGDRPAPSSLLSLIPSPPHPLSPSSLLPLSSLPFILSPLHPFSPSSSLSLIPSPPHPFSPSSLLPPHPLSLPHPFPPSAPPPYLKIPTLGSTELL